MNCPSCTRENAADSRFCIYCGAPLLTPGPQGAAGPEEPAQQDEQAPQDQPAWLQDQVQQMANLIVQLADRVASLERLQGIGFQETPRQKPAAPLAPPTPSAAASPDVPVSPLSRAFRATRGTLFGAAGPGARPMAPVPEPAAPPRGPAPPSSFDRFSIDWEQVLGLNWLAIVGSVALAIGMGFFLRLAFENEWIDETGRIILGISTGVAMLAVGEYAQRRYPAWAQAVTGGGIGILYLSIYAAFGFYDLIDVIPAFLFLGLVVAVSGLLALRYESLVIALLGLLGAFLTPVLLGGDVPDDQQFVLLGYILLVDLGILGVSTFRNWRWFTLVGLVASYALFGAWVDQIADRDLLLAHAGLTGIFLIFVGATTLFHILWRRMPEPWDLALMTLNAAVFYGITFGLLWDQYEVWFGLITLSLSLFYGLVGYAAIRRSGAPPQVALYSLATALIFLTVAAPLQLSGSWITVAWAAEGAVLVWVGFVLRSWPTRAFGLGVLAIAAFRLLVFDTAVEVVDFQLVLNDRFPTFVVAIAAFYTAAYLYWRERTRLEEWEENAALVLVGAANLFTLWILSAELIAFFDSRALAAGSPQAIQNAENGKFLALTAAWAVYAFGLLAIALTKRSRYLRWAGLGLLSIPVIKLLLIDTFVVDLNPSTFTLVLNFYFLTFLMVLAVVVAAAYLYWRQRGALLEGERYVFLVLVVVANFVVLWVLSTEAFRFFDRRELTPGSSQVVQDAENGLLLALTALWAVYALALLAAAWVKRSPYLRWGGLALLAVSVIKLLLIDTFAVNLDPRTFTLVLNFHFLTSLIVLGAALFAVYLYWRRRGDLLDEERYVFLVLVVVANAIAVWTLSAEAIRFFDAREFRTGDDLTSATHLSLTILWAVYAIGIIATGIVRGSSRVRLAGLVLLGIPVLKLFLFDVFLLDQAYRVAAFVTLGALLLATGLAYQRYGTTIKEFFVGEPS